MEKKGNQKIPEEARYRIDQCSTDVSQTQLDLSGLGLTKIPTELATITHLRDMYLSKNELSKIEGLPEGLTSLDLSKNELSKIEGLPESLTSLDLSGNEISKIEGFPEGLTSLDLSDNRVSKIEGLPESLTSLDLSGNRLSKIEGFPEGLTSLDLSDNEISKIEGLPESLTSLDLSGNEISKIEGLPESLTSLNLEYNEISKIEGLPESLTSLDMWLNEISKIEGLPESLISLDLSDNQISLIEGLPDTLTSLDLRSNRIENYEDVLTVVPLLESNQLKRFNIAGNPFLKSDFFKSDHYRSENHSERLLSDLNFIINQKKQDNRIVENLSLPVKLLLLGNSEAGKSTLRGFLTHNQFSTKDTTSTDVLEVSTWHYKGEEQAHYGLIYDFGGQDYFHGTYQLFFSEESVYTVVWDQSSNENKKNEPTGDRLYPYYNYGIGYWLGNIRYLTSDLPDIRSLNSNEDHQAETKKKAIPVTLIENKIDLNHESTDRALVQPDNQSISDSFRISLEKSPENVSAYSERRKLVKEHLKNELSQINDRQSFRTDHALLIQAYLDHRDGDLERSTIPMEHFLSWCFGSNIPADWQKENMSAEVSAVLRLLHNRGLLLFYHDDPILSQIVFLSPTRVLQDIKSKLFDQKRIQQGKIGASNIALDQYELQLAISQSIIFDNTNTRRPEIDRYIIPALLSGVPQQERLLYEFATSNMEMEFALRFKGFVPYGMMNRLICGYGNNPHEKHFYQNELIFRLDHQTKVWIQCIPEDLTITVYLDQSKNRNDKDISVIKYLFHTLMACYYRIPVLTSQTYHDRYHYGDTQLWREDMKKGVSGALKKAGKSKTGSRVDPVWDEFKDYEKSFYLRDAVTTPNDLMISLDDQYYITHKDLHAAYEHQVKEVKGLHKEDLSVTNRNISPKHKMLDRYRYRAFSSEEDKPPKKVFVSYAHADIGYKEELMKYLIGMRRDKLIEVWEDGRLNPGDQWGDKIRAQLEQSEWVILLISQQFINSSYIYETELKIALENMENKRARIIPIIIEDCDWSSLPLSFKDIRKVIEYHQSTELNEPQNLSSIEAMPKNQKSQLVPINEWDLPNKAWMEVVRQLRGLITRP